LTASRPLLPLPLHLGKTFEIIKSKVNSAVATLQDAGIGPDEKRLVLDRVLRSSTFSRSDQLKRFLQYICEKEISGRLEEVNEYSIAVEALGRPASYSPADDSSVRTRAHALRQKLQEYYELEDPQATLRIEVPKGAYTPHFSTVLPSAKVVVKIEGAPPSVTPPSFPDGAWARSWKPFLSGGLVAALIMGLIFVPIIVRSGAAQRASQIDAVVRSAWGAMLNSGTQVAVCIATPPAMLLHSYKDGQLPSAPAPLLPASLDVASWYARLQMLDGGGKLYMHTTQDVFLFGDSLAATSAVQLLSRAGAVPQVIPESSLQQAFALRGRNVVLIGSPNYSPLAARYLMNTPFSVHYDPVKLEEVVSDGLPESGARQVFRPAHDQLGRLTRAYGLVTVLPSGSYPENKSEIFIFSGITSAGPQAALEFFQSPQSLRLLESKLGEGGPNPFPRAYQVVVRCGLDHNLALNWEYETHRIIKNSPLLN
jgi:hypothetical protein